MTSIFTCSSINETVAFAQDNDNEGKIAFNSNKLFLKIIAGIIGISMLKPSCINAFDVTDAIDSESDPACNTAPAMTILFNFDIFLA
jgi:hypothetical protein